VFEAAIWVKSTRLIKSRLKTRKERENMEIKEMFTQRSIWKIVWNGIHSFLRQADARGSVVIIYRI